MNSVIGRKILGLYYRAGKSYRVPFGPLFGAKLYYDTTVNFHAVLGLWEWENFRIMNHMVRFLKKTKKNITVCDVGANIGMISIWLSKKLSTNDVVIAFEPSPSVLPILRKNIDLNNIKNLILVEKACSDRSGYMEFYIGFHHHVSSLHQEWAGSNGNVPEMVLAETITIDNYFFQNELKLPDFIKIDIEGGGTFAIPGIQRCVFENRPLMLIESHTPKEDRSISDLIIKNNYIAYRVTNKEWVKNIKEIHPNVSGVWGTLFLCPSEHSAYFKKILP